MKLALFILAAQLLTAAAEAAPTGVCSSADGKYFPCPAPAPLPSCGITSGHYPNPCPPSR